MDLKEIRKTIKEQRKRIEFYKSEILRLYENAENGKVEGSENLQKLFENVDQLKILKAHSEKLLVRYLVMEKEFKKWKKNYIDMVLYCLVVRYGYYSEWSTDKKELKKFLTLKT